MTKEELDIIKAHLTGEDLDIPRWMGETEELIATVEQLQKDLDYANGSTKNLCEAYDVCTECEEEKVCMFRNRRSPKV
jgi:hypothetical protein